MLSQIVRREGLSKDTMKNGPMRLLISSLIIIILTVFLSCSVSRSIEVSDGTFRLQSIYFVDEKHGWILAQRKYGQDRFHVIARTTDGGHSWEVTSIPKKVKNMNDLSFVSFSDRLQGIALGRANAAFKTRDGGVTWEEIHPYGFVRDLHAKDGLTVVTLDSGGVRYLDQGRSLETVGHYRTWKGRNMSNIHHVQVVDSETVWLRDSSEFFLSDGTGEELTQFSLLKRKRGGSEHRVNSSFFLDDRRGWVSYFDGTLHYTDNRLMSLKRIPWPYKASGEVRKIHFFDEQRGIILGSKQVLSTENGGNRWDLIWEAPEEAKMFVLDDKNAWVSWTERAGYKSTLYVRPLQPFKSQP